MPSWLEKLGRKASESAAADTEAVRRIAARLEAIPPRRARFLAAFAYVLARAANADLVITTEETRKMEELVAEAGELPADQAALVIEIAKAQNRLFGGTEDFLVTREFKELTEPAERQQLLEGLFAVAAADESITSAEEAGLRQIASELGFSHPEFAAARSRWSAHRAVLKGLAGGSKRGPTGTPGSGAPRS
jgi:uncharacterized tellurite resistance protein B-like protein